MKKPILVAALLGLVSCTSPARRPAEQNGAPAQATKIAEMSEDIKNAPVPGFDKFKTLNMKFDSSQTWQLVSLGSGRPDYGGGTLPAYKSAALQIFDGKLDKAAFRSLTDPSQFSDADYRRILHPNGICLRGTWKMDNYTGAPYSGQFRPGTEADVIIRASAFGSNVMVNTGDHNSFGFVGRVFVKDTQEAADFITQTDLGGVEAKSFFQSDTFNAPPVSFLKRKNSLFDIEISKFAQTGHVFDKFDSNNSNRQMYTIAELGKGAEPTHTPPFVKFAFHKMGIALPKGPMDFRREIQSRVPFTVELQTSDDPGKKTLLFGKKVAPDSPTWHKIGEVTINEAVISYACDFRLNIRHAPWRDELDKPGTERPSLQAH